MMENLIWKFRINKILSSEKINIQASPNERLGLKHNDRLLFSAQSVILFSYVIECYFGIFLAASILRKMKRRIVNPHSDDPP